MAIEDESPREIRLVKDREPGVYGAGLAYLEAEPGKTYKIKRTDARLLVGKGDFEYVGKSAPLTEQALKKLLKPDLVKLAMDEGASTYIERLTVPQLIEYLLTPARREELAAQAEDNNG